MPVLANLGTPSEVLREKLPAALTPGLFFALHKIYFCFAKMSDRSKISYFDTIGSLKQRGLMIQRYRVRDAIMRVDPIGRLKTLCRRRRIVFRRQYNVHVPNYLWYVYTLIYLIFPQLQISRIFFLRIFFSRIQFSRTPISRTFIFRAPFQG